MTTHIAQSTRGASPMKNFSVNAFDGLEIPVWTRGRGPTLLIVHGAAADHHDWDAVAELLEPHFTVATMHRRCTMGDPLEELDFTAEFRDVAAVTAALDGPVTAFGHSSGALCVLGAALQPEVRLARLIVYEPPLDQSAHHQAAALRLLKLLHEGDIDAVYRAWVRDYAAMPAPLADMFDASAAGAGLRRYARYLPREMAAHQRFPIADNTFAGIRVPLTYLVGSFTPPDEPQLRPLIAILQANNPGMQLRELPGQGHFAGLEAPALLADIIRETVQGS
jgi:pimeloyl-ACP methyl ester carboxylesterase